MKKAIPIERRYQAVAWGALLLWWGLRWWPLAFLPSGSGLLGTALILFGANFARNVLGLKTESSNTKLGLLALMLGGLLLSSELFGVPAKVPLLEASLIGFGLLYMLSGLTRQPAEQKQQ